MRSHIRAAWQHRGVACMTSPSLSLTHTQTNIYKHSSLSLESSNWTPNGWRLPPFKIWLVKNSCKENAKKWSYCNLTSEMFVCGYVCFVCVFLWETVKKGNIGEWKGFLQKGMFIYHVEFSLVKLTKRGICSGVTKCLDTTLYVNKRHKIAALVLWSCMIYCHWFSV